MNTFAMCMRFARTTAIILLALACNFPALAAEEAEGSIFVNASAAELKTSYEPREEFFETHRPDSPGYFDASSASLSWSAITWPPIKVSFHRVGDIGSASVIEIRYRGYLQNTVYAIVNARQEIHPFFLASDAEDFHATVERSQVRIESAQRGVGGSKRFSLFSVKNSHPVFLKEWKEKGRFD